MDPDPVPLRDIFGNGQAPAVMAAAARQQSPVLFPVNSVLFMICSPLVFPYDFPFPTELQEIVIHEPLSRLKKGPVTVFSQIRGNTGKKWGNFKIPA